jgi:tRNA A37 threonylcarbamoyladenosine modification protein TsaB
MFLAISAQDLRTINLALCEGNKVTRLMSVDASPEAYLAQIDQLLQRWGISLSELNGIMVVTGPGSFTSVRVSVTVANAIAFARNIPIFSLENPKNLELMELIRNADLSKSAERKFVFPAYGAPVNISMPKY